MDTYVGKRIAELTKSIDALTAKKTAPGTTDGESRGLQLEIIDQQARRDELGLLKKKLKSI